MISYDLCNNECDGFHRIVSFSKFFKNLVSKSDAKNWYELFWDKEKLINIEKFCIRFSEQKKMEKYDVKYINYLICFLKKHSPLMLENYCIIPSIDGKLCKISALHERCDIENPIFDFIKENIDKEIYCKIKAEKINSVNCSPYTMTQIINVFEREMNLKLAESLVRIIPETVELHEKQSFLYKMICMHENCEENPIPIKSAEANIWNEANKLVINVIIEMINGYESINDMINANENIKTQEDAILILNGCYKFIPNDVLKVPDRNGIFKKVCDVSRSTVVDEELVKLYELISGNDLTGELLDIRITNNSVEEFDQGNIFTESDKCIEKLFEDDNNKEKINEIANVVFGKINPFEKINENSLYIKLRNICIHKIYAKTALANLNVDSVEKKKGWIWELVLNAIKSVNSDKNQPVQMSLLVSKDCIKFKHNGPPFTRDSLVAQMYMHNPKNPEEEVTSFALTHALSKVVEVDAYVKSPEEKLGRMKFTLYRDGSSEETLIQEIEQTEKSLKFEDSIDESTYYTFKINDKNQEAANLGIEEYLQNISRVFIFNSQLQSAAIVIKDEPEFVNSKINKHTMFTREPNKRTDNNIQAVCIKENENKHKFIVTSINEESFEISGAIEINEANEIIGEVNPVFQKVPILGFQEFLLPFTINCNNFVLSKDKTNIDIKDNINKNILENSLKLYTNIVDYCCTNNIQNMYMLLNRLKYDISKSKTDDSLKEWYINNILIPLRNYIITKDIVPTNRGMKKIYIPASGEFDLSTDRAIFYSSPPEKLDKLKNAVNLFVNTHPTFDESMKWEPLLWDSSCILTYEILKKEIAKKGCLSNIKVFDEKHSEAEAINEFIKLYDVDLLTENLEIFPNKNGKFMSYKELKTCKINQDFLNVLRDNFNIDISGQILHEGISSIQANMSTIHNDLERRIIKKFHEYEKNGHPDYNNENCKKVSKAILSLTRKNTSESKSMQQKVLIETYNILCADKITTRDDYLNNEELYGIAFSYVIYEINFMMSQYKTVAAIIKDHKITEETLFKTLSDYYDMFCKLDKSGLNFVIPNGSGDFIEANIIRVIYDENYHEQIITFDENDENEKAKIYKNLLKLSDEAQGEGTWKSMIINSKIKFKKVKTVTLKKQCEELEDVIIEIWNKNKDSLTKEQKSMFSFLINIVMTNSAAYFYKIYGKIFTDIFLKLKEDDNEDDEKYNELLNEKEELEKKFNSLHEKVNDLNVKNEHLTSENERLKREIEALRNGIRSNQELNDEIERLRHQLNSNSSRSNQALGSRNQELINENANLNIRIQELNNVIEGFRNQLNNNQSNGNHAPRRRNQGPMAVNHTPDTRLISNLPPLKDKVLPVNKRIIFLYLYLQSTGNFSYIELDKLTTEKGEDLCICYNKTSYYLNGEKSMYDITCQDRKGNTYHIAIRTTFSDARIDINSIDEISNDNKKDKDNEEFIIAVMWGEIPSIENTVFLSNSKIVDLINTK